MKKRTIVFILILALGLCCFGPGAAAADGPSETAAAEAETLPIAGSYYFYSVEYNGKTMKPSDLNITSTLTLNEDGTGVIVMNGAETNITKWEAADGTLTLYNTSGAALPCGIQDGIVTLEMGANYYFYYAHEGTGIAADESGRATESMLYALREKIEAEDSAHLAYTVHTDYMDFTTEVDAQAQGEVYYTSKTSVVGKYRQVTANLYKDGELYVLYPDKRTGNLATSLSSNLLAGKVLMLDDLYQSIYTMSLRGDYTVETREVDEASYTVEVFPATEYKAEAAFYFNEEGELVYVLVGAPVIKPDMGETFYTLRAIDTEIDEALFDISGYKIDK